MPAEAGYRNQAAKPVYESRQRVHPDFLAISSSALGR
jgi:hypothetical protein